MVPISTLSVLIPTLITVLLPHLPVNQILMAGIVIAIVRWKHHPIVSLLFVFIFAIKVFISLPLEIAGSLYPLLLTILKIPAKDYAWASILIVLLSTLFSTLSWSLVVISIFGWRFSKQKEV